MAKNQPNKKGEGERKESSWQRGYVNFSRLKDRLFDSTLGQGKQQARRFLTL
jgi:hypothetical protein